MIKKYCNLLIFVTAAVAVAFAIVRFVSIEEGQAKAVSQAVPQSFFGKGPQTSVVHSQFNFHVVAPGIWRSGQPNQESLLRMKQYGLKTVINLRNEDGPMQLWEKALAEKLSLKYCHFPMDAWRRQNKETLKEILRIISDPTNQPVLVHCHAGKDRTGLVIALYKLQFSGARFDDVYKEMLMYGYDEENFPEIIETVRSWKER